MPGTTQARSGHCQASRQCNTRRPIGLCALQGLRQPRDEGLEPRLRWTWTPPINANPQGATALSNCPLCRPDIDTILFADDHIFAAWVSQPAAPGHCLIATRRHIPTWWESTREERTGLLEATFEVRRQVEERHRPEGYHVGFDILPSPGRTVGHLHLHVLPRYAPPDPRDCTCRSELVPAPLVLPVDTASLAAEAPSPSWSLAPGAPHSLPLIRGEGDPFYPHLRAALSRAHQVDIAVAFLMPGGWSKVVPHLEDLLSRRGSLRLLTGDYMDVTDPDTLMAVLDLRERWDFEARIFQTGTGTFHPKCYLFRERNGNATAFVGSSNLSASALGNGLEWNYRALSSRERAGVLEVQRAFEDLFHHPATLPLTEEWVRGYRERRAPALVRGKAVHVEVETPEPPPEPHAIQIEAMEALAKTREEGNRAGLVVLATGLGKTWLAAFDSRPFEQVLFVAHREEILGQALDTFRRLRPTARMGFYTGTDKDLGADLLFASIQTLGRQPHLDKFARDRFEYVVVDEFHHAAAATYRKLLAYFEPRFLLGLTATPDRTDGEDLLTLCGENLVYRRDVLDGISSGLLCPFHYHGLPDDVDYQAIPWRNNRFDEEALTAAVATRARAHNILEQFRRLGGSRAVAFCVSVRHARFMKSFLEEQGLRVAAIHSEPDSDPRATSLERLGKGELDILFAVDMFNEGVDLPEIDTVLMLRPTESRILWIQQFGRGLRKAEGKPHLKVLDYIGNHRTFLIKTQTLFDLPPGDGVLAHALQVLEEGPMVGPFEKGGLRLPPGCEVNYDLKAVSILRALLRPQSAKDALRVFYEEFRERNGQRPRAAETMHAGYNPRAARPRYGSWPGLVRSLGDLQGSLPEGLAAEFIDELETRPLETCGPLLLLQGLLEQGFPKPVPIAGLSQAMTRLAQRNIRLKADLAADPTDVPGLQAWNRYLATDGASVVAKFPLPAEPCDAWLELLDELVEWRLAEALRRAPITEGVERSWTLRVGPSGSQTIGLLQEQGRCQDIPDGETEVEVEGQPWKFRLAQEDVKFAAGPGSDKNQLPSLLRQWFGPDAGLPGTDHRVVLEATAEGLRLCPISPRQRQAYGAIWERYAREEIPLLFGMKFSQAIWNVGFLKREKRLFLLVTLDKENIHSPQFAYQDRFLSDRLFQWQSQNKTEQESNDGLAIRDHRQEGYSVHLFVRPAKKGSVKASAFFYCGQVDFRSWENNKPITVCWELREPVPAHLHDLLGVPNP